MTDGEDAFVSAIATFFPNMQRYLDWGHIFKNAKRALARSNITNREEVARYMSDLRTLFYKSTELNYHKQYNEILSGTNDQKEIHSKISYIGRWRLQLHGLATGDTNASESFNCVLKRLQDWDERPVDVIARGFLLLCQYHDTEILRGRYGMGDLTLKSSLSKVLKHKLRNNLIQ